MDWPRRLKDPPQLAAEGLFMSAPRYRAGPLIYVPQYRLLYRGFSLKNTIAVGRCFLNNF